MENGEYSVDVTMSGGSGKAHIVSPAKLTVTDGDMSATVEWSSPNYDYMEIDGAEYYPVNDGGNSQFVIDIPALDTDIDVKAETTAMSRPHMIDYTLRFTLAETRAESTPAFMLPAAGAAVILAASVIFLTWRRSYAKK